MATSGIHQIDLRDPAFLSFLNSAYVNQPNPIPNFFMNDPAQMLNLRQFNEIAERQLPTITGSFEIVTALRRQYRVYRDNQVLGDQFLTMPIVHTIWLNLGAVLGVAQHLIAEERQYLLECFNAYDPQNDNLEQYANDCIVKYNSTAIRKLESKDFDLFPKNKFNWISSELKDGQEKWLYEIYKKDATGLIPGLFHPGSEEHNLSDLGYSIQMIHDEFLLDFIEAPSAHQIIEVPKEKFANEGQLKQAVIDKAEAYAKSKECEASNPILIRITDAWWPDAEKVIWEWGYIDTGCGGFHFYKPVRYCAEQRVVLFATATYADADERLRKIFESSVSEAGNEIIALWTGNGFDISTTINAFLTLVWDKIKQKTGESIKCLIPDLYIVIETKEWKKA